MRISDPQAIRALAHPLRLDLMELLATTGPATAAQCGRVLGVPQANCSFHLRQLAKYGYVEEAGPGRDRRERQWRVAEAQPTVRIAEDGDAVVKQQLERLVVEREMQAILDHRARGEQAARDEERGVPKAAVTAAIAVLSADEAAELEAQWLALLQPYLARGTADSSRLRPGRHRVRYFMAATPLPDFETGENENDADD
ncbi:helix-turn-helix domain-containing protein [Kitasatospora sp. NBC_01266]|uniref:helix-turn-helix domain-containing protein n=1 Tax=Kitasatospora sp. NBC_01266 TaxID=2903572 RepID=UPI002E319249|nr:helix-turn-helix domain-containing protein [Kitasatospora sp. NBC_01266]